MKVEIANWYKSNKICIAGYLSANKNIFHNNNENWKSLLKGNNLNKSELVDAVATSADIPKAAATRALDAMIQAVTETLKGGDQVVLVGFGTFSVKDRAARTGRNPQTGEPIQIKAAKVPAFKAGKALKDAVNS